jgi:4-amino-4-deoxy-L-arabinose transferase-like glycosyltransferase
MLEAEKSSAVFGRGTGSILYPTLLLALCGAMFFSYLGKTPFFDKGEPREAIAVQDIVQRGEWLFPLKRATAIPSKPPLFHWSAALTARVTGKLDEATIRFPSALYATLGVLIVYMLGRKLFGGEVALLGASILATTMIYANQALSARVDMTLTFFVTTSLVVFYSLYRGFLKGAIWYYCFYALVAIGTLAKGPLGILLPALVAGTFLALKRRWDLILKFCFHPGVLLTVLLGGGWYAIAITRGGEGFVNRQLLQENLNRFFGGSGHSHPIYYYIPYLFSQGLPWSLFFPFLFWDWRKNNFLSDEDVLFFKLWFVVMFVFFSISMGKRPVYLLPLYPGLSLLLAAWLKKHEVVSDGRLFIYRCIAVGAGVMAVILLVVTTGNLWNHDVRWLLTPVEWLLDSKDRGNFVVVTQALASFGWGFIIVSLFSALLWTSLAHRLWFGKLTSAAQRLVLISILFAFVSGSVVMPVIAESKSYRPFMEEVNSRVKLGDKLFIYGESFNTDPVVFYRGAAIEMLREIPAKIVDNVGPGRVYIIMAEKDWAEIHSRNQNISSPLLTSNGTGPEGDARLVLIRI